MQSQTLAATAHLLKEGTSLGELRPWVSSFSSPGDCEVEADVGPKWRIQVASYFAQASNWFKLVNRQQVGVCWPRVHLQVFV